MGNKPIECLYAVCSKSTMRNTSNLHTLLPISRLWIRNAHTHRINKNFSYITNEKLNITADPKTMKLNESTGKPLCIILNWLMASNKQVMKYANIYLEEGFDVLRVHCEPWQILWPHKGAKVIGKDLMKLMEAHDSPFMVHGFSVGGYVWSEAMVYAMTNKQKYQPVLDRVEAQVWDSVADITEASVGVSKALFSKSRVGQKIVENIMDAYLKAFYSVGTIHYKRACETYYASPCRAPALFLLSSTDPIGNEQRIRRACNLWIEMGIQCTWQCWPSSPHVLHYLKHTDEYVALVRSHIRSNVSALWPDSTPQLKTDYGKVKQVAFN